MGIPSRRRGIAAALTFVLTAGLVQVAASAAAQAADPGTPVSSLPSVGPVDPNTGYPFWYQDATGQQMELCIDREGHGLCLADLADKTRRPYVGTDPADTNLAADPETFWFDASATIEQGGDATYVVAKEATFGGADEGARAGEQISFGRVRIRVGGLVPGATYVVTHPYGKQEFVAEDRDGDPATPRDGEINSTEDLGCFDLPCDFRKANQSSVTSYLRWDPNVGPAAPAGYVGDPGVPHQVVGSPTGTNLFRVEGPDVGGPGVDRIQTDLFSLQGKLWEPTSPMLGMVSTRNLVDFGRVTYAAPTTDTITDTITDTTTEPVVPGATQTLTLTNAGGGDTPLRLGQLQLTGADHAAFTLGTDGCSNTELPAGTACEVQIGFTPQTAGAAQAQVEITSNGVEADPFQRILLRGVGSDGSDPKEKRATGPLSLQHGFPLWYQDETGLRLALCEDPNDAMCPPAAEPYDPLQGAVSFPGNFPHELFWWAAEAHTETNNGHDAELVMAQEAAFLGEVPAFGEQMTFGRVRVRVGGLTAGETYKVTTPYGVYEFVAEDDEDRGINFTEDLGCMEGPCDYTKVNQSNVGPFLQRTENQPEGYVGDPNADGTVTPGTHGSVFRVEGPNIYAPEGDDSEAPPPVDGCPTVDGPVTDCVEIDQYSVSGKVWQQPAQGMLALADRFSTIQVAPAGPGAVGETRLLTLTNVGGGPADVGGLSLSAGSGFEIVDDACSGLALEPGAVCTVGVRLAPGVDALNGPVEDYLLVPGGGPAAEPGKVLLRGRVTVAGSDTARPSVPDLQAADDTGFATDDDITRSTTVTVSGASATGRAVAVLVDGQQAADARLGAASWSADLVLTEGRHVVTAAYADGSTSRPLTVTVDGTPPAAAPSLRLAADSDTGVAGDNVTADLSPRIVGTAPAGAHTVRLFVDGAPTGEALVQAGGTWAYTPPQLTVGVHEVTAVAVDAAGNRSAPSALVVHTDVRLPVVSAPDALPLVAARLGARLTGLVTWSGQDAGTAVASFRVQVSRNGRPYADVALPSPTATSVRQRLVIGDRYRYRVRATDTAGNVTPWAGGSAFRASLTQDDARAVRYRGPWREVRRRNASERSLSLTDARGATATLRTRATSVGLVASTGPNRGRAAILVNGRRHGTVDLYSTRVRHRRLVALVDGLRPGTRSRVQVRALGRKRGASNGTRVYVDGFVVQR